MNIGRATALFFLGVLSAATAGAFTWIVPGVANIASASGSFYYFSDLAIVNPASTGTLAKLSLISPLEVTSPPPKSYSLAAGQTLFLGNVLGTVWTFQGIGAIRVSSDARLVVFARTP